MSNGFKMKTFFFSLTMMILTRIANSADISMIQADKTFLGNIPENDLAVIFDEPAINKKYKVEKLNAKVGDVVIFMNRDEVSHNVSGTINGENSFDVKLQKPGLANDKKIELTKKGEYIIQCAIHPKMKINVKVD